jgi:hypothetical protein
MTRFFNRFFNNPIIAGAVLVGVTYTGYRWWFENGEWGWFVAWLLVSIRTYNAIEACRREAEFNDYETGKPPLYVRLFGHPTIAWPVFVPGLFIATFGTYEANRLGELPSGGVLLAVVGMFLVPSLIVIRWFAIRQSWMTRNHKTDERPVDPLKPKSVPVAAIVTPAVSLGAPAIPDAMQRLPASLLELVRDGAQATRATMRT